MLRFLNPARNAMLGRMAEFSVNPTRHDPYKNFNFRVKWDGAYIAGISRVTGLIRTTGVVEHREGGDPFNQPEVYRADAV